MKCIWQTPSVATIYRKHHTNNVETVSPATSTAEELADVAGVEKINQLLTNEATLKQFQVETTKDKDLQVVKEYIQRGWPGLN